MNSTRRIGICSILGCAIAVLLVGAPKSGLIASAQGPGSPQFPSAELAVKPEMMKWVKTNDPGRDAATLKGDPSKPGLYINIIRWKPNAKNMPHKHPDERYGIVLSGTFYLGHGTKFDPAKLETLPAGTFFTEPAGDPHFGVTKDEGVLLYFVGTGPSRSDYVEP